LDIIRCRTKQALASAPFEEISESTLLILVKDDELSVTEIELFDAIRTWGLKECERREVDESISPNLREVIFDQTILKNYNLHNAMLNRF
jgi:hypothetical protein